MMRWLKSRTGIAVLGVLALLLVLAVHVLRPQPLPPLQPSSYEKSQQADFNRPEHYPLALPPTISPDDRWYRPVAEWSGRLILPTEAEYAQRPGDWVWLEVHNAPQPDLIGTTLRLTWQLTPRLQRYLATVTVDVEMGETAARSRRKGDVLPKRLNGRQQVGPLQSLAGARPVDDVLVRLPQVELQPSGEETVLALGEAPVQIAGRQVALVKILATVPRLPLPMSCPGATPCPSDWFRVRHYNPATQAFDGPEAVVHIPQQPRDRNGRFMSSVRDLENSPAGDAGWYLYGAFDRDGHFTAQAIQPRSLLQLIPDQRITETAPALNFITWMTWRHIAAQQGTLERTLIALESSRSTTLSVAPPPEWHVGDRGLLIHLFGGIGGTQAESGTPGTVTGHFSYGMAEVVRDRFTGEPQFQMIYHQIYGHNPNAIIAGAIDWSAYTGSLERGWLGMRPISDVIVKLDALNHNLAVAGPSLSLLDTLLNETQIIAARYRTGDGTGVAPVTPATSCVQDSSQALYIAIETLKRQVRNTPELADYLNRDPGDADTQAFLELVSLGQQLENLLVPYGVVRSDWKQNAQALAGVNRRDGFVSSQNLINVLLSWRSMMPRRAHDDLAQVFLKQGAQLWFLRTNQVGGDNPAIAPLAPTELFGKWPIIGTLIKRLSNAVSAALTLRVGLITLAGLMVYGAIALPYGFASGFLQVSTANFGKWLHPVWLLKLLVMPAIVEEVLFRIFLLPHPLEGVALLRWLLWSLLSLALFVIYHPLNAALFYPPGRGTFRDRRFLLLTFWLGLVCTGVYGLTGAFWAIVLIHWLVVVVWLKGLGGLRQLETPAGASYQKSAVKS